LKLFEADLLVEGSFAKAMEGCEGVFHVASPFPLGHENVDKELLEPAVNGTKNVINTAIATLSVSRIVLVSSVAALYQPPVTQDKTEFDENDWNTKSSKTSFAYFLSKTEAEKVAWDLIKDCNTKQPQRNLSMVSILPSVVFGPPLNTPASLNTSNQMLLSLFYGGDNSSSGFVDVRDVSNAIEKAFSVKKAHGRYICNGGSFAFSSLLIS